MDSFGHDHRAAPAHGRPGIVGVLLAGGRGRRLGGDVPKALACIGGRTLLERQLATLSPLCAEVLVVAPAALALPTPGARRVDDPPGSLGPLAALVAGLAACAGRPALVLAVDLPGATAAVLARVAALLGEHHAAVVADHGSLQPLLGAYGPGAGRLLAQRLAAGERALVPAVAALEPCLVEAETLGPPARILFNLNTPQDAARAEALFAAEPAA